MSFGTGYHETTRLILELLPEAVNEEDRVLDVGTGTGILSIAAIKLGAGLVYALDIDDWSVRNAEENALINGVGEQVIIQKGSVEQIPGSEIFDLIIANINRTAILELLPGISRRLKKGGMLLLSGLLISERDLILEHGSLDNYALSDDRRENEWIALQLTKKSD